MTRFFFYSLAIVFSVSLNSCITKSKPENCTMYLQGSFRYKFRLNNILHFYSIVRNDTLQYEKNLSTGDSAVYKITWTDSCIYELRYITGNTHQSEEELENQKKSIITTTILGGTEKYYLFKTTANTHSTVLNDTIWVR